MIDHQNTENNVKTMRPLKKNAIPQSVSLFFTGIDSDCGTITFFETPTAATDCTKCTNVAIRV